MIRKIAIAAALIWAFNAGLNMIDITQATTVQNAASAAQLAELD